MDSHFIILLLIQGQVRVKIKKQDWKKKNLKKKYNTIDAKRVKTNCSIELCKWIYGVAKSVW